MFNILKRKQLIDREVELYKKEKFLEIDRLIEDYRSAQQKKSQNMAQQCAEELGDYEHKYHHTKEVKGIELAKLEAKIEALSQVLVAKAETIKADQNLHDARKAEIDRLNKIIHDLINKQPNVTVQQMKQ